jgi:methylmalonyl-CoA mutase
MSELTLAGEFPGLTQGDWIKRVEAVLKGASFDATLVRHTAEAIRLQPLYGQLQAARAARPLQSAWTLFQRIDHPDPVRANAQALEDLENGATGLVLVSDDTASARGFGLNTARLARVLQGVHLHAVWLRVEGGTSMALATLIADQPIDPERLNISFAATEPADAAELARLGYTGPYMEADGRSFHEQGASDAQELGATLATAVATLRRLDTLNDMHLVRAVGMTLAAHQDMFATLAKFRAARLLWARVLDAAGLPDAPLRLHAETSWRMMAKLDPHTNILRATAAVFGAGLGGADSITVLPFSLAQGLPNAFARRVARNLQSVLLEEANLWRVADPASGAGYVETYTQSLCQAAWTVFRNAESGNWPAPDRASPHGLPVIGTTAYQLKQEYAAEIEATP